MPALSSFPLGPHRSMGNRKRKSAQQPPMGTLDSCVSISGGDDAVYEELPSLFGSSPKRVALESHSSDLSTQSELLCGEWLGYMSLDSSFDVALHSSPSRTSNSSSASADSILSVGTTDSGKGQGHHAGHPLSPLHTEYPATGLQPTQGDIFSDETLTIFLVAHVACV